jgi:hypothetical protein
MCKRSALRRVPPRHCSHQGEHRAPRVTRHAATTRPRAVQGGVRSRQEPDANQPERSPANMGGLVPTAHSPDCCAVIERRMRVTSRPAPPSGKRSVPSRTGTCSYDAARHRPGVTGTGSDPAQAAVDARTPRVRDVVAQPHRPGEQLGLEALRRGPAGGGPHGRLLRADSGDSRHRATPSVHRIRGGGAGAAGRRGEEPGLGLGAMATGRHGWGSAGRHRAGRCGVRRTATTDRRRLARLGSTTAAAGGISVASGARRRPTDANWAVSSAVRRPPEGASGARRRPTDANWAVSSAVRRPPAGGRSGTADRSRTMGRPAVAEVAASAPRARRPDGWRATDISWVAGA